MLTGLSPALADNWEPMTGADTLHELVAGATAEIALTPEVTAVGKYNARDIQREGPSGVGAGRSMGRPWKFGVQYWHYIETPDTFDPDYQLRFSVSPVVKLPW